ncbi:hypothetical protein ACNKHU_17115 [Shigella flexneri]
MSGFRCFSTEVHLQTHLEKRTGCAQNRCSVSSGTVSGKVNGSGEQIQNVLYQPGWPQVAIHEHSFVVRLAGRFFVDQTASGMEAGTKMCRFYPCLAFISG